MASEISPMWGSSIITNHSTVSLYTLATRCHTCLLLLHWNRQKLHVLLLWYSLTRCSPIVVTYFSSLYACCDRKEHCPNSEGFQIVLSIEFFHNYLAILTLLASKAFLNDQEKLSTVRKLLPVGFDLKTSCVWDHCYIYYRGMCQLGIFKLTQKAPIYFLDLDCLIRLNRTWLHNGLKVSNLQVISQ